MAKGRSVALAAVVALLAVGGAWGCDGEEGEKGAAPEAVEGEVQQGAITVRWQVPTNLTDTTLAGAAAFAWQEFIALNWPAVPQTGQPNTRDMPNTSARFGDPSYAGPLVWHTFRAKVEIFPPVGAMPNGYVNDSTVSYGYDALPQYTYASPVNPFHPGQAGDTVPWINLDENDEIGLDAMYAGVATGLPFPSDLILFMAKANRAEYTYVARNQFFNAANAGPAKAASSAYVVANRAGPPPGSDSIASLPTGTIEIKAAWRQLTQAEADSGRFYQTRVRYYRAAASGGGATYVDTIFGLVALHIIQKTPGQPFFVFATFEQADNILDAQGNRVEDVDGNVLPQYQGLSPMDTVITSRNAQNPAPNGYTPQNIQALSPDSSPSVPGKRLYYRNSPGPETQGAVSINRRVHSIPPTIVAANRAAHAAIAAYNQQNGIASSPWQFYKLINVQYQPIDKPQPGVNYNGADSATYYQANAVVETDVNLQTFSGMFQPGFTYQGQSPPTNNLITDWCGQNAAYPTNGCQGNSPFHNVYANGNAYNMGGCMGCHGNAQLAGSDFSFILLETNNNAPQLADPVAAPGDIEKFYRLFPQARPPGGTTASGGARGAKSPAGAPRR